LVTAAQFDSAFPFSQTVGTKYPARIKDVLFIGGPKSVQGVDRINYDLVSILTVDRQ
jgi:hypothetical protein